MQSSHRQAPRPRRISEAVEKYNGFAIRRPNFHIGHANASVQINKTFCVIHCGTTCGIGGGGRWLRRGHFCNGRTWNIGRHCGKSRNANRNKSCLCYSRQCAHDYLPLCFYVGLSVV